MAERNNRRRNKRRAVDNAAEQEARYLFGWHAVESIVTAQPDDVATVFVDSQRQDDRLHALQAQCEKAGVACVALSKADLSDLVATAKHQGVIAEIKSQSHLDESALESIIQSLDESPFLLVLDSITDPRNLGACLRSAEAAGVHAVIVPKDQSAPLNAAARKVACGAAELVPLIYVTNLVRTMQWLRQYNVWFVGAAGETDQTLYETDLKGSLAIVMGSEDKGLRRLTRENCDFLCKIPMIGSVESLNVSVATGICLFEANRQRSLP